LDPLLNATALSTVLLVRVTAPVYRLDDCVGVDPFVV
jgi:hypothetical protein